VDEQWSDPEFLGAVFAQTEIVRKPLTGIITGYHVLPYILVGPEHERPSHAVEVRGRIKVSPRLIVKLTPSSALTATRSFPCSRRSSAGGETSKCRLRSAYSMCGVPPGVSA